MVTSRTTASKKTTSKTATGTAAKKPLAKKAVAATQAVKKPAVKAKTVTKKVASTPVKKASAKKTGKPLPAASGLVKAKPAKTGNAISNNEAQKVSVSPQERYQMIAAAAYLRAERRNFAGVHALDDWIAAEAEIDAILKT